MDRMNSRIAQVYGYAVCFITVIVMLISIKSLVDAVIDLTDPIAAESGGYGRSGRSLSSFELYKLDSRRDPRVPVSEPIKPVNAQSDTLSDAELRRLYEAEREQAIRNVHFRAVRTLIGNGLLIIVAVILFLVHWRWLRERDALPATTA
ncbi:MAG TPA: hypothetical protein VFP26_15035 [Gemmatimonadaceae bacterium]|jgi:hypothetical protein|nr:hypothetical protein [Gemmatimonadaceae bacterium]